MWWVHPVRSHDAIIIATSLCVKIPTIAVCVHPPVEWRIIHEIDHARSEINTYYKRLISSHCTCVPIFITAWNRSPLNSGCLPDSGPWRLALDGIWLLISYRTRSRLPLNRGISIYLLSLCSRVSVKLLPLTHLIGPRLLTLRYILPWWHLSPCICRLRICPS